MTRPGLAALTIATFLAADLLRASRVRDAAAASLAGWVLLLVTWLAWARRGRPRALFRRHVARVAWLTAVAAAVLLAYVVRSHVLDAGTHVDAVYTWIGLQWALRLSNPITFVGNTPSYAQSPLMLLSHAPAMAIGFAALGPLAMHLGVLLVVAGAFAVVTAAVAPGQPFWKQAAAVALAAACASTRFFVQGYDAVGYLPVGVCLGLGFVAAVAIEDAVARARMVGGLVAFLFLQDAYLGTGIALPLCAAWLLLRRHPIRAVRAFVAENAILLIVLAMLAITIATHADVFLHRLRDVSSQEPPLAHLRRLAADRGALMPLLPAWWWWHRLGGSWHLLDLPPLAGPVLPAIAAMWACSLLVAARPLLRTAAHAVVFVVLLAGISFVQHVVTSADDYRDFPLVFGLTVAALLFVLRAPALFGVRAWIAWLLACVIAVVNFVDAARIEGHRHVSNDYAPREVSMLEALRCDVTARTPTEVGASRLALVLEDFPDPMRGQYLDLFKQRGFTVTPLSAATFCRDLSGELARVGAADCNAFLLAAPATICNRAAWATKDVAVVLRYETACPTNWDEVTRRWRVLLLPQPGKPSP
jgi:hypothetical protein